MSKSTLGPWTWHGCELLSPDTFILAVSRPMPRAEIRRLIAAAPELYEAAIELVDTLEDERPIAGKDDDFIYDELGSGLASAYFNARDAIAKAKGAQP